MLFMNKQTGEFGLDLRALLMAFGGGVTVGDIRSVLAGGHFNVLPMVASLDPYEPYTASAPPEAAFWQEVYEVAPIAGAQQWALRDSTLPLATLQAQRVADVEAYRGRKVAAGYVTGSQVVDIDDAGRADLTSMMASANASLITILAGTTTWPSNYAAGWVTRSGALLALPRATDGVKLATAALNYYSALIQREAALKRTITAVASLAALKAIDITAGWPANPG